MKSAAARIDRSRVKPRRRLRNLLKKVAQRLRGVPKNRFPPIHPGLNQAVHFPRFVPD